MKNAIFICDPDVRITQQIAVGLSRELQKHGAWTIHVLPNLAPFPDLKQQIRNIEPDAVATSLPSSQLVNHLERLQVPLVVVAIKGGAKEHTPTILPDEEAIGAMAAEYLLAQKFEHLAVFDKERRNASPRIEAFCHAIRGRHRTRGSWWMKVDAAESDHPFGIHAATERTAEWLKRLPKPCGIFAH